MVVGADLRVCPAIKQKHHLGQSQGIAPTMSLGDVIRRFKTMTTRRYIDNVIKYRWRPFNRKLWQRNYWERVIRDENELIKIREYIVNNPLQWALDSENPKQWQ